MASKRKLLFALGAVAGIGTLMSLLSDQGPRSRFIAWARSQIGSRDSKSVWQSALEPGTPESDYPKDWCGGFLLAGLHAVGLAQHLFWKIGSGFLIPNLAQTKTPVPGDIAYFDHNQHEALVTAIDDDGMVSLINGNGANGQVSTSTVPMSSVTAFFSLDRLLTPPTGAV